MTVIRYFDIKGGDPTKDWVSPGAESLDFYLKDQTNSEMPLDEFQSLVGSPPFMSKYRMTVIRNLGLWANRAPSSASEVEKWKAAISSIPEFSAVIFVEDKVDKRKKQLLEAVSGVGTLAEFSFQNEETKEYCHIADLYQLSDQPDGFIDADDRK